MKLTATMMLTVDGVYQGPGAPDEDRRDEFTRGGWVASHFDDETGTFAAPRRGRSGLTRDQHPAQVRPVEHAQGSGLEHPRDRR